MKEMKGTAKLALAGILTALSVVVMMMTWFSLADYAIPALAGMLLIPAVIELGQLRAMGIYCATAVLSALFAPGKEAAVMYIAFLGYYPVLKSLLERIPNRVLEWAAKLAAFNLTMVGAYYFVLYVLGIPEDLLTVFGKYGPLVLLLFANVVFIIYDIGLTRVIRVYLSVFRQRLHKMFG